MTVYVVMLHDPNNANPRVLVVCTDRERANAIANEPETFGYELGDPDMWTEVFEATLDEEKE